MALDTNAEQALTHVAARYKSLSIYGTAIARQQRLGGGLKAVPTEILGAYNAACNDYRNFSAEVFSELAKNKMVVEQVVYHGGVPDVGPDGNVRTVRLEVPLQPPFVSYPPGVVERIGKPPSTVVEMGIAPALLAGYAVIGIIVVAGAAVVGYWTRENLREYRMTIQGGPDYEPDKVVDAWERCLREAERSGFTPQQIAESGCSNLLKPQPKSNTGWGLLALGAIAIAGTAYVLPKVIK